MSADEDKRWKVGELARSTGLTVRALHHYDDIGLLVPSRRTTGGHRVYDARDVRRLYRVLALRRLGLRLDAISAVLDDGSVSLLEIVRRHLERVEREIEHQHRLRERLRRILEALQLSAEAPVEDYIDAVEAMAMIEIDVQDVVMRIPNHEADGQGQRSPREGHRVVLLKEHGGERILPIWIGAQEGDALVYERSGHTFSRPLTPDLTVSLLQASGTRVDRIVIESLHENTFFATVIIVAGGKSQEVDARPSDALNLAVRLRCPIFVASEVIDHAGVSSDGILQSRLSGQRDVDGGETLGAWQSVTPDLLRSLWRGAELEQGFTSEGQQVLSWAREKARALSHEYIRPEHILLGMLRDPDALAGRVLRSLDVTPESAYRLALRIESSGKELTEKEIALSPATKKLVELAFRVAVSLGPSDVGPEHMLLAMAHENSLVETGANPDQVREEVRRALTQSNTTDEAEPT